MVTRSYPTSKRSKNTPLRIAQTEKEIKALELRKAGLTYDNIAKHLDCSLSVAWKLVHRALDASLQEPSQEVRRLEQERLDALLRAVWMQALAGKPDAVRQALSIMDRRSKLLGLDAPTKTSLTVITEDVLDAEIQRLEAEIAAKERTDSSAS